MDYILGAKRNTKKNAPTMKVGWSKAEDELLQRNVPVEEIMEKTGRSHYSIANRRYKLGLTEIGEEKDIALLYTMDAVYIRNTVRIGQIVRLFSSSYGESPTEFKGKIVKKYPNLAEVDINGNTMHIQWTDILRWNRDLLD